MALWDTVVRGGQQAWNWGQDNPLGVMAGAGDLFSLMSRINNMVQSRNQQAQYQQLLNRGPRVSDYYAPMSDAEKLAYTRGVAVNNQQFIPPQSAAFSDLLGTAMASRESERYQNAAQLAQRDWMSRLMGKGMLQQQAYGGAQGGAPGQAISQYLLLRQLLGNRGGSGGGLTDTTGLNLAYDPSAFGGARGPYDFYNGTQSPMGEGWAKLNTPQHNAYGAAPTFGTTDQEWMPHRREDPY
jgi:hypothetical protein